jgi:hypothetical protein
VWLIHEKKNVYCVPGMVVHAVISAFVRLRQEDQEFVTSLGYMVRPCPKKIEEKSAGGMEQVMSTSLGSTQP